MIDIFLIFMIFIFVFAALARDRFVFTILYLFAGAYLFGRWWGRRSISNLKFSRSFDHYAFINEMITVKLNLTNSGWLPIVWLRVQDALPIEISRTGSFRRVLSLGPKESINLEYQLAAQRRGYYRVGPLNSLSSDLLGLAGDFRFEGQPEYLTVFPRVIPFMTIRFPSSSPLGSLRHQQPIFEDPNRPIGKRDYFAGDSLRRIDWKATASVGKLQVKLFEPSIDLQVVVFLNMNLLEYETRYKTDATELAVTTAASITNWAIEHRLSVGLYAHASDAADRNRTIGSMLPNKGRSHLVRILEVLARVQFDDLAPINDVLDQELVNLSWGTTLILITGMADDTLFDVLYRYRKMGINVVLIVCGGISNYREAEVKAGYYGIPFYLFNSEKDLDIWRR
jgi:uncharacterized protein (DUF58 family)